MNRRGRTGVFGVWGVADSLKQTRSGSPGSRMHGSWTAHKTRGHVKGVETWPQAALIAITNIQTILHYAVAMIVSRTRSNVGQMTYGPA